MKLFLPCQLIGIAASTVACFTTYWPAGLFFLTAWAVLGVVGTYVLAKKVPA